MHNIAQRKPCLLSCQTFPNWPFTFLPAGQHVQCGRNISEAIANGRRDSLQNHKSFAHVKQLQVLRMKDDDNGKGSPLAVQSSAFASLRENLPSSLKTLQWEIENSTVRYELEPEGSVRIVDPPEHRQWPDTLLWTDASILKHLRS
jgi:hypothetical protein